MLQSASCVVICSISRIHESGIWSIPSVWLAGFLSRILPWLLKFPGYSCQDSYQHPARSWKIIYEFQDSYQEIQESRRRTKKSRDNFPFLSEYSGWSPRFSRIFQDLPGSIRIAFWSPEFTKVLPMLPEVSGCSPRFSWIF